MDQANLLSKRDQKLIPHLNQYAPVWLTDEKIIMAERAVQFNVVFEHNRYGWVTRRYRYDGFNDVLYHKGQTIIAEDQVAELESLPPFLQATVTNVPNAYGG